MAGQVARTFPARRYASVDRRAPAGVPVAGTGGAVIPGSNGIPILTVVIVDYAGKPPMEAAAEVWVDWQTRYPGALIQVVHGVDQWEPLR